MTTCGWLFEVMLDDASAAYSYRREIDADRGAGSKDDSKKAREVVAQLYEALDEILPYAANMLAHDHPDVAKARAAFDDAQSLAALACRGPVVEVSDIKALRDEIRAQASLKDHYAEWEETERMFAALIAKANGHE